MAVIRSTHGHRSAAIKVLQVRNNVVFPQNGQARPSLRSIGVSRRACPALHCALARHSHPHRVGLALGVCAGLLAWYSIRVSAIGPTPEAIGLNVIAKFPGNDQGSGHKQIRH